MCLIGPLPSGPAVRLAFVSKPRSFTVHLAEADIDWVSQHVATLVFLDNANILTTYAGFRPYIEYLEAKVSTAHSVLAKQHIRFLAQVLTRPNTHGISGYRSPLQPLHKSPSPPLPSGPVSPSTASCTCRPGRIWKPPGPTTQ